HILIEKINGGTSLQAVIHTFWGGRLNSPFSLALSQAWEERFNENLEIIYNNECLLLNIPSEFDVKRLFELVNPQRLEKLLRKKLENSGIFGAHFRENAGRSLLLPKSSFNKRVPLWLTRLRSKELLETVKGYADFPVLLETWRSCINDEFELGVLEKRLCEIEDGLILISSAVTERPSPFAQGIVWQMTNKEMYASDEAEGKGASELKGGLIREAALNSALRPLVPESLALELEAKLQRTHAGFAPETSTGLFDWVKERLLIPRSEWQKLTELCAAQLGAIEHKLCLVKIPGAEDVSVAAVQTLPLIATALGLDHVPAELLSDGGKPARIRRGLDNYTASDFIAQWISYYGPVSVEFVCGVFALPTGCRSAERAQDVQKTRSFEREALFSALGELFSDETLVMGHIVRGRGEEICDSKNLERLLRMYRRSSKPVFRALPASCLQLFIAQYQSVGSRAAEKELGDIMGQLLGYPSSAESWEKFILPARINSYYGNMLDDFMRASGVEWFGCGKNRIAFSFPEERAMFISTAQHDADIDMFPSRYGAFTVYDLQRHTGLKAAEIQKALWNLLRKGLVTADSFDVVRNAAAFDLIERGRGRAASPAFRTMWRPLFVEGEIDLLAREELTRELVRQLIRRYGIVFRELLWKEFPAAAWKNVFRSLRLMELSGELVTGYFFEGIPGPQFMSGESFRALSSGLSGFEKVFWMSAADPASLCGIPLPELRKNFPPRIASNFLVFRGDSLKMELRRGGAEIIIHQPSMPQPLEDAMPACFDVFDALTGDICIQKINGGKAAASPFSEFFLDYGFKESFGTLVLRKQYA
ncbi:MAG: hypothetical protein LBT84_06380, partial [Spirochaetia bacterium]|nr:hypothetical protein [Spirochaetia bacterium]